MIYGERAVRTAFFVSAGGVDNLKRVPFMESDLDESWIRHLLESNPSMLPAGEISTDYSPLICIGSNLEIATDGGTGTIDNLLISPSGHIVITKAALFRNQVSRQATISQMVDIAMELQQWDAEDLENVAEEYFYRQTGQAFRIIDAMAKTGYLSLSDEASLTDAINEHLMEAAFLLMIVGDGIRSNVYQLAEFLSDNSCMAFDLGLVELELYPHSGGMLVIPNLLTKTSIVERRCSPKRGTLTLLGCDGVSPIRQIEFGDKPLLSRRDFVEAFSERGGYDPDLLTEFLSDLESVGGISVRLAPGEICIDCMPRDGKRASLLHIGISAAGEACIFISPDELRNSLSAAGHFPSEADDFLDFFKAYIDLARSKSAPYEFGAGKIYYASVGKVLESPELFVGAAERLIFNISES